MAVESPQNSNNIFGYNRCLEQNKNNIFYNFQRTCIWRIAKRSIDIKNFDNDIKTKTELISKWNEGWNCLFDAINSLTEKDLEKEIYIRNMGHSVSEAINRQLAHYPYHIGQIGVYWKNNSK